MTRLHRQLAVPYRPQVESSARQLAAVLTVSHDPPRLGPSVGGGQNVRMGIDTEHDSQRTMECLTPFAPMLKVCCVTSLNEETTRLLLDLCQGNQDTADRLLPVIYDELRRMAGWYMRGERTGHTLDPTALVHEAFLRLRKLEHIEWTSRSHFCAVGAHIMRRILVDHARRRGASKRGHDLTRMRFDEHVASAGGELDVDLLDLEEALNRLADLNPRHVQVVEMRFFAGLSVQETAAILNVSASTVKNDWRMARAWLLSQME